MQLPFELVLLAISGTAAAEPNAAQAWPQQEIIASKQNFNNKKYTYQCFSGDLSKYPSPSTDWLSWSRLWDINREQVLSSNGGDTYLQHYIMEAILQVAEESTVDASLILATIMQESKGRADTPCTSNGSRCGIMHAPKGATFNADKPQESILRMIWDGVEGRSRSGPGFAVLLNGKPKIANLPPGNHYAAARMYNSGAVGTNLDTVKTGDAGYVNDLANRLIGWNGRGNGFHDC